MKPPSDREGLLLRPLRGVACRQPAGCSHERTRIAPTCEPSPGDIDLLIVVESGVLSQQRVSERGEIGMAGRGGGGLVDRAALVVVRE